MAVENEDRGSGWTGALGYHGERDLSAERVANDRVHAAGGHGLRYIAGARGQIVRGGKWWAFTMTPQVYEDPLPSGERSGETGRKASPVSA